MERRYPTELGTPTTSRSPHLPAAGTGETVSLWACVQILLGFSNDWRPSRYGPHLRRFRSRAKTRQIGRAHV